MARSPEGHSEVVKRRIYEIISESDEIGFNQLDKLVKKEELCTRSTLRKYLNELKEILTIEEYSQGQYHYFTTNVDWIRSGKKSSVESQEHLKTIKEFINYFLSTYKKSPNKVVKTAAICLIYQQLITMSFQNNLSYAVTHFPKLKKIQEDAQKTAADFLNSVFKLEDPKKQEDLGVWIHDNIAKSWRKQSHNFATFVSAYSQSNQKDKEIYDKFFQSIDFIPQIAEAVDIKK